MKPLPDLDPDNRLTRAWASRALIDAHTRFGDNLGVPATALHTVIAEDYGKPMLEITKWSTKEPERQPRMHSLNAVSSLITQLQRRYGNVRTVVAVSDGHGGCRALPIERIEYIADFDTVKLVVKEDS